jgi:anti-sigma factor RsiW
MIDPSNSNSLERREAKPCEPYAERMYLLTVDELERPGATEVESHAGQCAECAAFLLQNQRMMEMLAQAPRPEPSADLLSACRVGLTDALDEAEVAKSHSGLRGWFDALMPTQWLAIHPAAAAVLLIFLGFTAGAFYPRWSGSAIVSPPPTPAAPTASLESLDTTPGVTPIDDQYLRTADITGINWEPSADDASPEVQVHMKSPQPMVVQGTPANNDVKRVLLYVLRNNQRFAPDVRINSVEMLKVRAADEDVRQALCQVLRSDQNAAVRLKALEALDTTQPHEVVQQTLMTALVEDANPGVRIEAINTLREMQAKGQVTSDPRLLEVLHERARKDPSTYIRLQSAAMIQDLGPREKF